MEEVNERAMKLRSELGIESAVRAIRQMSEAEQDQLLGDLMVLARVAYEFINSPEVRRQHGAGQVGHDLGLVLESVGQYPCQRGARGVVLWKK